MQTLPKVGEPAFVHGISFPLVLESISEETRLASLKGEHPISGVEVQLSRVCLSELHDAPLYAIGQYARLKSYGPLMTVVEVRPPLPDAPEGAGTTLVCWYFNDAEFCEFEGDARTLHVSDKRCGI